MATEQKIKISQKAQKRFSRINHDNKWRNELLAFVYNTLKQQTTIKVDDILDYMNEATENTRQKEKGNDFCHETEFLYELARFLDDEGEYRALIIIHDEIIKITGEKFDENSMEMMIALNKKVEFLIDWEDFDDAAKILVKLEKNLTNANPNVIVQTMKNQLNLSINLNNGKQAVHLLENLLPIKIAHSGIDNEEVYELIITLNNYYCKYEQHEKAKKMLENILEKMEKTDTHPLSQTNIMDILVDIYWEQKNIKTAIKYSKKSLELKKKSYPDIRHRKFAKNYQSLAFLYFDNGNKAKTEHFCKLYLETVEKNGISPEPKCLILMAGTCLEKKEFKKAVNFLENAFEIGRQQKNSYPNQSIVITTLWVAYTNLQDYQKMNWLINEVQNELSENIKKLNTQSEESLFLFLLGKNEEEEDEEGEDYISEVISISCALLGEMALNICEIESFGTERALEIMHKTLSTIEKYEYQDIFTTGIFLSMAKIYAEAKNFAKAKEYCEKVQYNIEYMETETESLNHEDSEQAFFPSDLKEEIQDLLELCNAKNSQKAGQEASTIIDVDFAKRTRKK